MSRSDDLYPLDLGAVGYAYVERPNATLLGLCARHVLTRGSRPRILDVGCGAGANARAIRDRCPDAYLVGIEPNERAAELARAACDEVFGGLVADWLAEPRLVVAPFDGVLLSDVIEHQADPLALLRALVAEPSLAGAVFVVSVPNYAVWYSRLRTLGGRFEYAHSGLFDRTHLRFFTAPSLQELLAHAGLAIVDSGITPSLVQAAAPWLRRAFADDVARGAHLALAESPLHRVYRAAVEPVETALCRLWPSLLGFQIVVAAREAGHPSGQSP
ncbi:MAG: class I SAM-dependent methyltransferase [Polyangiaceae bacterium]|nr:class I SAM-dependent methyltransferase [Polyangiaceae bacterium]